MAARIIFNPAAGDGKAARIFEMIQPYINEAEIEVVRTEYPGHATLLAQEVKDRQDMTVISLGGDGTHHEVVNGLLPDAQATFGVIPAGTGNDFVRMLRYPDSPVDILPVVLHGPTEYFDVGRLNERYFLTVSGVGFDAEVAGWVNSRTKQGNGTWVFLRGVFRNLLHFRSQPITVSLDGTQRTEKTFMIAVGNTKFYGGGMKISPEASPHDGQFHVIWIGDISPLQVLPLLGKVFKGTHVTHPAVKTFQASHLSIDGPSHLWVHADGEVLGHLPITLETVPQALRVRVGKGFHDDHWE